MPFVWTVPLFIIAALFGWVVCGVINRYLFRRIFGHPGYINQRDLLVALGPMGLAVLIMCAGLMAYLKVCNFFGSGGGMGRSMF